MKKTIFLFILISFFSSCNQESTKEKTLEKDNILNDYFTSSEIKEMHKIVEFFEKQLSIHGVNQDSAYKAYFKELDKREDFDEIIIKLSSSSVDYQMLMNQLKANGLFKEIWVIGVNRVNNKKYLNINNSGKYVEYLKSKRKTLPFLNFYCYKLETMGALGPGIQAGMLKEFYKDVDFEDESVRLIFAIHYLTVVSPFEAMKKN